MLKQAVDIILQRLLLILPVFFNTGKSVAQNKQIDSLKFVLSNSREDTSKVKVLQSLGREFKYSNTDSSLFFLKAALELATKLNYEIGIGLAKQGLCALYADLGKYDEGLKTGNEALAVFNKLLSSASKSTKEAIQKYIALTHTVIGHNWVSQGNHDQGLKSTLDALKIFEELGDKGGVFLSAYNIAATHVLQHNYAEGLKYYSICLRVSVELGNKEYEALIYNNFGYIHFKQGNYTEALKNSTSALKIAEGTTSYYALGEIYTILSGINDKLKNYNEALRYGFEGVKMFRQIGIEEQMPWVYNNIGSAYMNQEKYNYSAKYLDSALAVSKKIGNLEYLQLTYQNLSAMDSAIGNYKKAFENYKHFIFYRDSIINKETKNKNLQRQMQYDFDKKEAATRAEQEKKDILNTANLKRQKALRNAFIAGFAFMLLFAGIFFVQRNKIKKGKKRSDELLLNILPAETAEELKATGTAEAKDFDKVTVLFTDFKNFTQASEKMLAHEVVEEIHYYFSEFDRIISKHNIEKIKTIGDSYMAAGGLPVENKTNPVDAVNAALEIRTFMHRIKDERIKEGKAFFEMRIGVHTGPVVAGIVGIKKFAYDIWGDTVNIASRMESTCEEGKVNISGDTYELVKDKFHCIYRGKIQAKHKGEIDMYFVEAQANSV